MKWNCPGFWRIYREYFLVRYLLSYLTFNQTTSKLGPLYPISHCPTQTHAISSVLQTIAAICKKDLYSNASGSSGALMRSGSNLVLGSLGLCKGSSGFVLLAGALGSGGLLCIVLERDLRLHNSTLVAAAALSMSRAAAVPEVATVGY